MRINMTITLLDIYEFTERLTNFFNQETGIAEKISSDNKIAIFLMELKGRDILFLIQLIVNGINSSQSKTEAIFVVFENVSPEELDNVLYRFIRIIYKQVLRIEMMDNI